MTRRPVVKVIAEAAPQKRTSSPAMKSTAQNLAAPDTKASRTRHRILMTAAQLFASRGYFSTNIRDIAAEAGIRSGAIYYHFENKEELAWAVVDRGVTEVYNRARESIARLEGEVDPISVVLAAFNVHLNYILEEENFALAVLRIRRELPEPISSRLLKKEGRLGKLYAQLLQDARDQGCIDKKFNLSALRMLLAGALQWVPEWYDPRGLSPKELVEQLGFLIRAGLKPRPPTKPP